MYVVKKLVLIVALAVVLIGMFTLGFKIQRVKGETIVSGYISSDTIWTLTGSPYIVAGDVIVETGVTLTIEPSVLVKFISGKNLVVDGRLIAQGNATHKIIFTSNNTTPAPGDWGSIIFRGSMLLMDYIYVEYASTGLTLESTANISNSIISRCVTGLYGGISYAENLTIKQNTGKGIHFLADYGITHIFKRVEVSDNGEEGIYACEPFLLQDSRVLNNSRGIYVFSGYSTVQDSMVSWNRGYGIYGVYNVTNSEVSYNQGIGVHGYSGHITRCDITNNQGGGIKAADETHFCNIFNNTGYDVRTGYADCNATCNWWGTTNETLIQERIYDYYDDFDLGKAFYKPFLLSPYFVTIEEKIFYVGISSNSTIANFRFDQVGKYVSFEVTGPNQTAGFCNISIPNELLWGDFSVYKDESLLMKGVDYTEVFNGTHYNFHITYSHTTHTIKIIGTEVIPEFSPLLILPLLMIVTLLAVILCKSKQSQ